MFQGGYSAAPINYSHKIAAETRLTFSQELYVFLNKTFTAMIEK